MMWTFTQHKHTHPHIFFPHYGAPASTITFYLVHLLFFPSTLDAAIRSVFNERFAARWCLETLSFFLRPG